MCVRVRSLPKGKCKVPPGCLLAELVTQVTTFFMPLEPSLGTMLLSSAIFQLQIQSVT